MEVETTQSDMFFKVMAWLHANRKRILIGGMVVAVIALVIALSSWRKAAEDTAANARFFAMRGLVGMAARAARPVPASSLLDLARQYPNTPGGEYALLLAGENLFIAGKYPEAQQEFAKFIEEYPESPLLPEARLGAAASIEAQGKASEAIQKYQELLSAFPSETHIVSPAKLTLARLLEQQNRPGDALTYYMQLAQSQNPYDPWAAEARERGQLLLAKHPELRRTEQPPTSAPLSLPQPAAKAPPPAPAKAPPGSQPAPAPAKPKSGINLLQFPGASSNSPSK
jgi:tetratricopeptide (TPR) repeat protein